MTTGQDHTSLIDEQLSAWLDDELPTGELELLATRLVRSDEHQMRLARYSLIGSVLRGRQSGAFEAELAALRLSGRIRDALNEPARTGRQAEPVHARRLLPYAMAAGVALFAVAVVPLLRLADGGPGSTTADRARAYPLPGPQSAVEQVTAERRASLSPARLTNYLVYHGEYSGMLSAKVADSHIVNQLPYVAAVQAIDTYPGR